MRIHMYRNHDGSLSIEKSTDGIHWRDRKFQLHEVSDASLMRLTRFIGSKRWEHTTSIRSWESGYGYDMEEINHLYYPPPTHVERHRRMDIVTGNTSAGILLAEALIEREIWTIPNYE